MAKLFATPRSQVSPTLTKPLYVLLLIQNIITTTITLIQLFIKGQVTTQPLVDFLFVVNDFNQGVQTTDVYELIIDLNTL